MKIEDNRNKLLTIHDIRVGDVFEFSGNTFMKIKVADSDCNAVRVDFGETCRFDSSKIKPLYNARLVIEDD